MGTGDLTAIGQFIQDRGLLTLMLLGFGLFFAAKVFPWLQKITESAIQIQAERDKQNDDRIERWAAAIMHQTSAIQQLTQLIETQHTEVMRRLELLDKK